MEINNTYEKPIDKYLKKYELIYNEINEQASFNEICEHYGLIKINENTYEFPLLQIFITASNYKIYAYPDNEQYFDSNIYTWIKTYSKNFKNDKSMFLTYNVEQITMSSLKSLIIFLDFMKLYENTYDASNYVRIEENKKYQKRIEIYKKNTI